jgi:hypothetical protein
MRQHSAHARQVKDADLLPSVHGEDNSYNDAKYGQTAGLPFRAIGHETLLIV